MGVLLKRQLRKLRWICYGRPEALWQRYVLGFLFIFVTVSASHWASLATITAAEKDAEVLALSNRQRMLSQRILFLMNEADKGRDPHAEQRLETALDLFEVSHNWLIARPDLPEKLQHLYFEQEPISLDAFSRRFIAMVGIASYAEGAQKEELDSLLAKWGKEDLMASLATAADLFRQNSEARISSLQSIQQNTLVAALFVLLAEALLIFVPAQVTVNTSIGRLKRHRTRLKQSLTELKERNAELVGARKSLSHAAHHDALTDLPNRRAVYQKLGEHETASQSGDRTCCVMKLDLDLFKQINDSLGHSAGDTMLKHVATVLKNAVQYDGFAGRIGGDEFVIVIDVPSSLKDVENRATDIIEQIATPQMVENTQVTVGASIGFTIAATSAATPDQMLIEADLALYEAKRSGRSHVCAYSDALAADIETRRMLFDEISLALSEDQFEPFLQPQICADTGALYGCEVLARWNHPDKGIVAPATFLAASEEAGLVDQIDRIILEKSLDLIEDFDARGITVPHISVNASPSTLRDALLPDRLLHEVQARHIAPDRLTVEVLESTLIESDDDMALDIIVRLSRAGFRVVLDDFGTGYASMSNLSRLKLDGIKLDQSLIAPLPDPRASSIIEALLTLSENLGMFVVAEGVETPAHFDAVQSLGCTIIQGYGISVPLDGCDFEKWYEDYHSNLAGASLLASG